MAKNTGSGHRVGAVKNRSQYLNSTTGTYLKRDTNGRFMSGKSTPYKGVRKESPDKNKKK